jgi:hypothetical protein
MPRKTPTKSRKFPKLPVRKAVARRAPRKVDFGDEEAVLKEVCKELDLDPSDCSIKIGTSPNGHGDAYTISLGRHSEYIVMEDDDEFETAARNGVEDQIKDDPSSFSMNMLVNHIDLDRLRSELHSDVYDMNYDRIQEDASHARDTIAFMLDHNIDVPSPTEKELREHARLEADDEKSAEEIYAELAEKDVEDQWNAIGDAPEIPDSELEALAEDATDNQLKDPMSYLEDIWGTDAPAQAIKIAGIDESALADEIVSSDGAAASMCGYDGNYETTKSGFIVWKHN